MLIDSAPLKSSLRKPESLSDNFKNEIQALPYFRGGLLDRLHGTFQISSFRYLQDFRLSERVIQIPNKPDLELQLCFRLHGINWPFTGTGLIMSNTV